MGTNMLDCTLGSPHPPKLTQQQHPHPTQVPTHLRSGDKNTPPPRHTSTHPPVHRAQTGAPPGVWPPPPAAPPPPPCRLQRRAAGQAAVEPLQDVAMSSWPPSLRACVRRSCLRTENRLYKIVCIASSQMPLRAGHTLGERAHLCGRSRPRAAPTPALGWLAAAAGGRRACGGWRPRGRGPPGSARTAAPPAGPTQGRSGPV